MSAVSRASRSLAVRCVALLCTFVSATLVAQTRTATWHVTEQWRVDGADAGDGFGDVRDFVALPDGRLWILDFKDQHIRRYDANGRALPTVARKGAGPGELANANGMVLSRDGTVWVNDPANGRFSVFGVDGKFVRQHVLPSTGYGYRWNGWLDRSTGLVMDPVGRPRNGKYVYVWRRIDESGKEAGDAEIASCGAAEFPETGFRAETKGKGSTNAGYPFMSGGGAAPDGKGGLWCARQSARRVALVRIGKNDTILTTTLDVPMLPVTNAERDEAIARAIAITKKYETNNFDAARVPRAKAGIVAVRVDSDGRLWVQHGAKFGERSTTFDVHDARGAHLGRMVIPGTVNSYLPIAARGNDVWMPVLDADDVLSIVKLRIVK